MSDLEQARTLLAMAERYEPFPDLDSDIDRRACIAGIARLLEHVRQIVVQTKP